MAEVVGFSSPHARAETFAPLGRYEAPPQTQETCEFERALSLASAVQHGYPPLEGEVARLKAGGVG
jgi:hypothetical protein